MKGKRGEIIAGFTAARADLTGDAHACRGNRRYKRCGARKVLDRGFYRDRTCRGGYRQICKRCRNRERAGWAAWVAKPFHLSQLSAALAAALSGPAVAQPPDCRPRHLAA